MPFDVPLEQGEELLLNEFHRPTQKVEPFAFGVSNRAIFLPAKKIFAVRDPWHFRRVPLSEVQTVVLRRLRSIGVWVLSVVMVAAGLLTTYWMLSPANRSSGGRVSGYPIAVVVVGLVLPFLARGRYALVVSLTSGSFKWKPPITVGGAGKSEGLAVQERILEACRKVGLHVRDDRRVA